MCPFTDANFLLSVYGRVQKFIGRGVFSGMSSEHGNQKGKKTQSARIYSKGKSEKMTTLIRSSSVMPMTLRDFYVSSSMG